VSPILVRPVREQLEHDRIIRLLQAKLRRKYDAGANPGNEQNAAVGSGPTAIYPDLVLHSLERGRRLEAVVEVETGESVNHLEALAEWGHFAKLRGAFHLYVPAQMVDVARRLCEDNQITVHEFWSYHAFGDEIRFTLVHRSKEPVHVARPAPKTTRPTPRDVTARRKPAAQRQRRPVKSATRRAASKKTVAKRKRK
jgi:hypothetical protein